MQSSDGRMIQNLLQRSVPDHLESLELLELKSSRFSLGRDGSPSLDIALAIYGIAQDTVGPLLSGQSLPC